MPTRNVRVRKDTRLFADLCAALLRHGHRDDADAFFAVKFVRAH